MRKHHTPILNIRWVSRELPSETPTLPLTRDRNDRDRNGNELGTSVQRRSPHAARFALRICVCVPTATQGASLTLCDPAADLAPGADASRVRPRRPPQALTMVAQKRGLEQGLVYRTRAACALAAASRSSWRTPEARSL